MALWWLTEAVPIYVTALLPSALFPLSGVASTSDTASPYAWPLIFLSWVGFYWRFRWSVGGWKNGLHGPSCLRLDRTHPD